MVVHLLLCLWPLTPPCASKPGCEACVWWIWGPQPDVSAGLASQALCTELRALMSARGAVTSSLHLLS